MSSSDKRIDWSVFRPRAEPCADEILSPAAEVGAVLQQFHTAMQEAQEKSGSVQREMLEPLARQAVLAWKLDATIRGYEADFAKAALPRVRRHFGVITAEMLEGLTSAGIACENPIGQTYETVVDRVHIQGWVPKTDLVSETVIEVLEPIVLWRGQLIHPGLVVMGRPATPATRPEPAPPSSVS